MNIILNKVATFYNASKEIQTIIMKRLTIQNPVFTQRLERGLPNWGVPRSLQYYTYVNNNLVAPVGIIPELIMDGVIQMKDIKDERTLGSEQADFFSKLKFMGQLRDYQLDIINACKPRTIGVIEAKTGSGKTSAFINLIVTKQVPTLILVNTIELANQTIEAIVKFTNITKEEIGFVGSGKFDVYPITVGLHQTMAFLPNESFDTLNKYFGMIIADETHICAAKTYYATMNKLSAKFKFGFSATPYRDDGLTKVINFATGPVIHKVPNEVLENYLIKPTIRVVETNYHFPLFDSSEYQEMISDLSIDKERNALIAETLKTDYADKYVILLCVRVEQVNILTNLLGELAVSLTSDTKKKDRLQAIKDLNDKTKRYVVSTYGLFSTGIDIPHMDTLFICAPIASTIKIKQSAGRLMRKAKDKTSAEIVDFRDGRVELLKVQFYKRNKIMRTL